MKKLSALFLLLCGSLCAQPFSAGVEVGAPFTDAISIPAGGPDTTISNGHYIIGPYGEVRLPGGFSVEIEALYRSFSSSYRGEPQTAGGNWEFPVLAKYKLLQSGPLKPYIDGGLVFSHLTGSDLNVAHDSNYGIALGAGVEIHTLFLRISPEIRYDGFFLHSFRSNSIVQSNRNQAMVLVGIGF
ncbi:MAG TPA: hypothetical protein VK708_19805 [Bryobacteraceae bacterium]|jgi:hypothetical protein|nr:hypothetical protein [Bryobacteraceae bacterium]